MNISGILMSVIPSIALLGLFWYVMRGILRADRAEREALARMDAEEAARAATLTEHHGARPGTDDSTQ